MYRALIAVAIAAVTLLGLAPAAGADPAPNPNTPIQACFGIVSGQLASSQPGATGEHASEQTEPRIGLGNIAFRGALGITFSSMGELGSFLASIDDNPATFCP